MLTEEINAAGLAYDLVVFTLFDNLSSYFLVMSPQLVRYSCLSHNFDVEWFYPLLGGFFAYLNGRLDDKTGVQKCGIFEDRP